jgi:hypothetical protein
VTETETESQGTVDVEISEGGKPVTEAPEDKAAESMKDDDEGAQADSAARIDLIDTVSKAATDNQNDHDGDVAMDGPTPGSASGDKEGTGDSNVTIYSQTSLVDSSHAAFPSNVHDSALNAPPSIASAVDVIATTETLAPSSTSTLAENVPGFLTPAVITHLLNVSAAAMWQDLVTGFLLFEKASPPHGVRISFLFIC